MGKNAKLKERQKWSHEKPQLDNARKLRGSYFIDPEDKECKETIKNARKKLETSVTPAMPCKTSKTCMHGETRGKTDEIKSKFACILEASESTRLRMEESLPSCHEDHVAGKGYNSLQHDNLVHKIYSYVPSQGDLEDSKSTSVGTLCVFGSHTFVPISWMGKKQTSVSHSSTESESFSLDAGLRLDGISALELWDLVVAVLGNTNQSHKERVDLLMNKREVRSPLHTIQKTKAISRSDQ